MDLYPSQSDFLGIGVSIGVEGSMCGIGSCSGGCWSREIVLAALVDLWLLRSDGQRPR